MSFTFACLLTQPMKVQILKAYQIILERLSTTLEFRLLALFLDLFPLLDRVGRLTAMLELSFNNLLNS